MTKGYEINFKVTRTRTQWVMSNPGSQDLQIKQT